MAIQFRRGAFADFIKSKMVAGEPAVVQSGDTSTQNGKAFYICYTPGSVDRVLTEQDKTAIDSQISDIEDDLAAAEQTIENVRQSIPAVDATLTTTGAAADAKKTGDEISDLKSDFRDLNDIVVGETVLIETGTHSSGYYTGTVGGSINTVSGGGFYYPYIDLSEYVGWKVRISYKTTSASSTRVTAICDTSGVIGEMFYEREMYSAGVKTLNVTSTHNRLYISASTSMTDLEVDVMANNGIVSRVLSLQIAYVSTSGSDTNSGTANSPFATIQKGVDSGAPIVKVSAGNYAGFKIENRKTPLSIMLDDMPVYSVSTPDVPKIKITSTALTNNVGVLVKNSANITLNDIWVDGVSGNSYYFIEATEIVCNRCYASDAESGNGFALLNCNGLFRNCKSWDVGSDGFNIHGYGNTQFIDCVAHDCGDDGISHHEGCSGIISGGEFYNCAKGGVASPTYGAEIDIENVYSHANKYGMYAVANQDNGLLCKSRISNCVIVNNTDYDLYLSKGTYLGWNNIYDTKNVFWNATFTEFPINS